MQISSEQIQRFNTSLRRATANEAFYDQFYDHFMAKSDRLQDIFHDQDMARIKRKLKNTLEMVAEFSADEPGLGMYLELLGKTHDRMHIDHHFFVLWRDALIETAAQCDPEFDGTTEQAWETVLDGVITQMGINLHEPMAATG